jgi:archaellum component FlaC
VSSLSTTVGGFSSSISSLESNVSSLQSAVSQNSTDITNLQQSDNTITNNLNSLGNTVTTNSSNISSLQSSVGTLSNDTSNLKTQIKQVQFKLVTSISQLELANTRKLQSEGGIQLLYNGGAPYVSPNLNVFAEGFGASIIGDVNISDKIYLSNISLYDVTLNLYHQNGTVVSTFKIASRDTCTFMWSFTANDWVMLNGMV